MLYPDWSLLLVNMRGSLHCKQSIQFVRNTIIQLPVVYEAKSTTSCQYMASCYYRDKGKVESKVRPVTRLFLDGNAYLLVTPAQLMRPTMALCALGDAYKIYASL